MPLEVVFSVAAGLSIVQLFRLGYRWDEIQTSIVRKLARALPAVFILFAIGVIISSWMLTGTIPMLVYYGLKIIDPSYIYLIAFIVPVVFSTLTGTSWGSVGTVGVVLIGVAKALEADMGIAAGAIIGGAYFGDKLSPLSDTTNLAALAADVDLFDHIQSMIVTTLPSALLSACGFYVLGFTHLPTAAASGLAGAQPLLNSLQDIYHFNVLLLLPPAVVLYGSLRRLPPIPTLLASVVTACVLDLSTQRFSFGSVFDGLTRGFEVSMIDWVTSMPVEAVQLLERGGLYSMSEPIFIAFLVFFFVGVLDVIDAMPTVVERLLSFAASRRATILSALGASAIVNALTSNQYATSFIVGDALRSRFDALQIPRKVLSRSIEDWGTMIESQVPWTTTAVFMVATLGVAYEDYARWQFLSLINMAVAPALAILGVGCFYHEVDDV